jgi:uncharacterized membrane protein HdeD (DUF308 family)
MTVAIGLLAVCFAYGVAASIFSGQMPAFHPSHILEYSFGIWLISGLIGALIGAWLLFDTRKCHLIYLGWAVAIPFVELFLAFRLYSEHWLLPFPLPEAALSE